MNLLHWSVLFKVIIFNGMEGLQGFLWWAPSAMEIVNSLWPSDTMCWHRSGSALAQVMACCLMAPSHYLNQCWPPIYEVLWYSPQEQFHGECRSYYSVLWVWQLYFKIISIFPRGQWVKTTMILLKYWPILSTIWADLDFICKFGHFVSILGQFHWEGFY